MPSHLWPGIELLAAYSLLRSGPIPVRPNFCAWECKLTPAGCACQEGNTIGCIPSNDGLGAGLAPGFPQEKQGFKVSKWQDDKVAKLRPVFPLVSTSVLRFGLRKPNQY
jgi:hypothetical protein